MMLTRRRLMAQSEPPRCALHIPSGLIQLNCIHFKSIYGHSRLFHSGPKTTLLLS